MLAGGRVNRLLTYVGKLPEGLATEPNTTYHNLQELLQAIAEAVGKWAVSFNTNPQKFETFLDRYDLIVSDSRKLEVNLDK